MWKEIIVKPGYPITLLLGLALLSGCDRNSQTSSATNSGPGVTSQELKDKYKDAAAATKNYLGENKDEFVASMNQKLKELDDKIAAMRKKSEGFTDDTKTQADKALANLREERKSVSEQFEKLKQSSAEGWEKVKTGFTNSMAELEKA